MVQEGRESGKTGRGATCCAMNVQGAFSDETLPLNGYREVTRTSGHLSTRLMTGFTERR